LPRANVLDMQKVFLPFFCACCCFASGVLPAASTCIDEQYETENGNCYPAWYGQTTSGAYYTIAKPEGWAEKDGLVIWNHGFQSFLTGFEATDLLSILNPSWAGYYSGEVQAKPGLGPYAETILAQGYAMAASSYSQTGWAVFDSHVSNSELYDSFLSIVTDESLGAPGQFYIIGGSLGGMQVLQFVSLFPDKTHAAIPIACSASHSAQNIALNELGRQAIMADPNWKKENSTPDKGLAVARMAAHITYLSKKGLQEKFGRKLQDKGSLKFSFDADFQIESYLRHQGSTFVDRFDANSYLYITRAMDYFDLEKQFNGNLSLAFKNTKSKFCVISFSSDWLYPTVENKEIVIALNACGANVGFVEINSDKGHDSFLLDVPEFLKTISEFLNSAYNEINNEKRI